MIFFAGSFNVPIGNPTTGFSKNIWVKMRCRGQNEFIEAPVFSWSSSCMWKLIFVAPVGLHHVRVVWGWSYGHMRACRSATNHRTSSTADLYSPKHDTRCFFFVVVASSRKSGFCGLWWPESCKNWLYSVIPTYLTVLGAQRIPYVIFGSILSHLQTLRDSIKLSPHRIFESERIL